MVFMGRLQFSTYSTPCDVFVSLESSKYSYCSVYVRVRAHDGRTVALVLVLVRGEAGARTCRNENGAGCVYGICSPRTTTSPAPDSEGKILDEMT